MLVVIAANATMRFFATIGVFLFTNLIEIRENDTNIAVHRDTSVKDLGRDPRD